MGTAPGDVKNVADRLEPIRGLRVQSP